MDLMHIDPSTYLSWVAPTAVIVGVVWRAASLLWTRFEKKLDQGREESKLRDEAVKKELLAAQATVKQELIEAHLAGLRETATMKEEQATFQDTTQRQLHNILEQTTRTNGRVSALELHTTKLEGILEGEERQAKRSNHDPNN